MQLTWAPCALAILAVFLQGAVWLDTAMHARRSKVIAFLSSHLDCLCTESQPLPHLPQVIEQMLLHVVHTRFGNMCGHDPKEIYSIQECASCAAH